MAHILIVGKAFSGIKQYLIERGHAYTLLQDVHATKFPDKQFKNRVVADFSQESHLLSIVDEVHRVNPIDATFVTYENYVVSNAIIAAHLGLPSLSRAAAEACTDKELMRTLFATAPEKISPDFQVVTSRETLTTFAQSHNFPLILKPANLAKSLLVTKNDSLEQLLANYDKAVAMIDKVYHQYARGRTPKLIVEEYLDGHIHSVDVFVDADGKPHVLQNVVDYQTGHDIGYDDNFHYSRILPSRLPTNEIESIRHAAEMGCRALGMTSSPAHVEIIYTAQGPMLVEIGARNGGYRERMHALANGIDITANALALSLNMPLDIMPKRNDNVGVFELFPKVAGNFVRITDETKIRQLLSFQYLSIKAKPGKFIGKAGDGYKMAAVVILHHPDKTIFDHDRRIIDAVEVKTSTQ